MKILIASATVFEIESFIQHIKTDIPKNIQIETCITGVGMMQAAFNLTQKIATYQPDFVLQAGMAGAFQESKLPIGSLVFAGKDMVADLGAEDGDNFLDVFELGLINENDFPFSEKWLVNPLESFAKNIDLPNVKAITVNTVSGHLNTIQRLQQLWKADIETMEGAALHFVCLKMNIPFAQVRAISNYIEPRDKSKWKMKEAIQILNEWLKNFVAGLR